MKPIAYGLVFLTLSACAQPSRDAGAYGSQHAHRFQQPPEKAARCFARNAEEHSSALKAEVTGAEVVVRVKNGVLYATASYRRSGSGSVGTIDLRVSSPSGRNELFDSVVEGC